MASSTSYTGAHSTFPSDIPAPTDDGACDHLKQPGTSFPSISLPSTSGDRIDISTLPGLTVLFAYPRTAAPNETVPADWNEIPGARGCTPQACSFRDLERKLKSGGVSQVFGVSTQDTAYQRELKERTHLPYELLSDEKLELVEKLGLPTMEYKGVKLIKRMCLAVEDGKIVKVWYPVFPPDRSAGEVVEWLESRKG
jgi:peroxiredoxin